MFLCFPEAVKVAVSVRCFNLFPFAQSKAGFRSVAGIKRLSLVALVGADCNPLNVVLGSHGMFNLAYGYGYCVSVYFNNGNVLFNRSSRLGFLRRATV